MDDFKEDYETAVLLDTSSLKNAISQKHKILSSYTFPDGYFIFDFKIIPHKFYEEVSNEVSNEELPNIELSRDGSSISMIKSKHWALVEREFGYKSVPCLRNGILSTNLIIYTSKPISVEYNLHLPPLSILVSKESEKHRYTQVFSCTPHTPYIKKILRMTEDTSFCESLNDDRFEPKWNIFSNNKGVDDCLYVCAAFY